MLAVLRAQDEPLDEHAEPKQMMDKIEYLVIKKVAQLKQYAERYKVYEMNEHIYRERKNARKTEEFRIRQLEEQKYAQEILERKRNREVSKNGRIGMPRSENVPMKRPSPPPQDPEYIRDCKRFLGDQQEMTELAKQMYNTFGDGKI